MAYNFMGPLASNFMAYNFMGLEFYGYGMGPSHFMGYNF